VQMKMHAQQTNIVTIYKRPIMQRNVFLHELQQLLDFLDLEHTTVVLGDFNMDVSNASPDHPLLQTMSKYGLNQHVTSPTTDSGSMLDLVFLLQERRNLH